MTQHHSDRDWHNEMADRHDIHARDYLANLRQLHNQLNPPPTYWEQFKDLLLVLALLVLFTSPIWIQALE